MIDIEYQEKLLNTREVAQLFRVPLKTVRGWVKNGIMRGKKINRKFFFRCEDVGAFMNEYLVAPFVKIGA